MSSTSDITDLLLNAKQASRYINQLANSQRIALTNSLATAIEQHIPKILAANATDLARMDPANPMYDRLLLNESRLLAIAAATREVATLPDPVGKLQLSITKPNGLRISKITVPLGVVGAIYEARPNVTIDIVALCLRSGNAVVLKGGSDAAATNACTVAIMQQVLENAGLPKAAITLLPNERGVVQPFLNATKYIDVIVPRGSQGLINFVRSHASVPVIETGAGVCHTYVHAQANLAKALPIVVNAKTQRPSVCNALDTILVDETVAGIFLPQLKEPFAQFGVGIYADEKSYAFLQAAAYPNLHHTQPEDFGREFLSQNCSVKVVRDLDEALDHIAEYSSKHSEAIITEDAAVAERFLQEVDAAAVYHNASTRFTDGGEFGLGAELGISTQKLHARGPFALEKLVCEKWIVRGSGQVR
jgi:glutamate-5-semialdehyde dehydrogenase